MCVKPKAGGDPSYNAPTGAMGQPGPQPGDHCLALYVDDGKVMLTTITRHFV